MVCGLCLRCRGSNGFHKKVLFAFPWGAICIDGIKAMVTKAWIRYQTHSLGIFTVTHSQKKKEEKSFTRECSDETVKINFIKLWPEYVSFYYSTRLSRRCALRTSATNWSMFWGKALVWLSFELKLAALLTKLHFYLKNWEKSYSDEIWVFGRRFLKNKVNLSLQGKQFTVLMIKSKFSSEN